AERPAWPGAVRRFRQAAHSLIHRIEAVMSSFLKLIKSLIFGAPPQRDVDEAYLAESVDIYDLERRMREIDVMLGLDVL
ncbi:DUF3563 family protein, partial [Piscinibacter sp.]|uniref:DUF3563 family protein n=1 Tax=Piscinibacter sp. TaxID=1903157 RepID=UPI002F3EA177